MEKKSPAVVTQQDVKEGENVAVVYGGAKSVGSGGTKNVGNGGAGEVVRRKKAVAESPKGRLFEDGLDEENKLRTENNRKDTTIIKVNRQH